MAYQNVVNVIPLTVLWDETGRVLDARRVASLGGDELREQFRSGDVQFLVADVGLDLVRIDGPAALALWKSELRPRLVPPETLERGFRLEDFPDEYCYVASAWAGSDLRRPTILFEKYH